MRPGTMSAFAFCMLGFLAPSTATPPLDGAPFVRGDVDGSGVRDISDAVRILGHLFLGSPSILPCADAADTDDSGSLQISDAIRLLTFLFRGGVSIPPPFGACGEDSTVDALTCESFPSCGCDELVPGRLSTVNPPRSHGLRLLTGSAGEMIALYHEVGDVWGQRLTESGVLLGSRVEVAAGVVDFDAAVSGTTLAFVWLSGGRVYGKVRSAADFTVETPETLMLSPGAATDQVRINYDHERGTLIVVYEIGGTLSAFSVPVPALRPASPSRILSIGVSQKFDVTDTGSPAYVAYTLDADGLLRGVRLNADGSRDGSTVKITSGAGVDEQPAIAREGATLGLAYGHTEAGADRLRFVVLDADLSLLRGPIDLPGLTDPAFLVHGPSGADVGTAAAHLGAGHFLVTALQGEGSTPSWYAHEVLPDDLAPGRLTFRRLHPEPCGSRPCLEDYTSVAAGVGREHALLGSTRKTGDSARVTALGCP